MILNKVQEIQESTEEVLPNDTKPQDVYNW